MNMKDTLTKFATSVGRKVEEIQNTNRVMMVYAIKDINADEYNTPFFQPTHAHALRVFKTEINRPGEQNLLYLYPEDFELHYLGTFDQGNGQLKPENEMVCKGIQLKNTKE